MGDERRPSLLDAIQGSVAPAMALLAGMQLGVFTRIGDRERTVAEIAAELGVDPGRLGRLLYALAHAGLLEAREGRFRNGPEAAEALVEGRPRYVGGGHELLAKLWAADLRTAESIRSGLPQAEHDYLSASPEAAAAFVRGLAPSGLAWGRMLGGVLDLSATRSVIDLGGGPGTVLVGLLERWPDLRATLLDLPPVVTHAPAVLDGHAGGERIAIEPGDIVRRPSEGQHDLAILRAVIQCLGREEARLAIRNAAQSLAPGGELLISGWGILDDDRMGPRNAVYVNITFLNLYRSGEAYTESEHRAWMEEAGLAGFARDRLPDGTSLIRARRPA